MKVAQLQVSVVPVERHVLARDQADAGAVQIRHTVHVQQNLGVPLSNEPIERLTQQLEPVLRNQAAVEIENRHVSDGALPNLHHRPITRPKTTRLHYPIIQLSNCPITRLSNYPISRLTTSRFPIDDFPIPD